MPRHPALSLLVGLVAACILPAPTVPQETPPPQTTKPKAEKLYTAESLSGKVVWLSEALQERFGVKTDDDVAHAVVALETAEGELHPLLKDARGRGFHTDERLRGVDMELAVRRYRGSPMVQVVRVYTIKPDGKYELDYWCDVCSIAMYELKQCECCQGPIRLRERLVDKRSPTNSTAEPGKDGASPEKPGSPVPRPE